MAQETNGALRETAHHIHRYIGDNLYFSRPDLEIKGEKFNSALLLTLLTGLRQGKELIIGEPGLGQDDLRRVCLLPAVPVPPGDHLGKRGGRTPRADRGEDHRPARPGKAQPGRRGGGLVALRAPSHQDCGRNQPAPRDQAEHDPGRRGPGKLGVPERRHHQPRILPVCHRQLPGPAEPTPSSLP